MNIGDPLGTGMKSDFGVTLLFLAFLDSFGKFEAVVVLAEPEPVLATLEPFPAAALISTWLEIPAAAPVKGVGT